MGIVVNVSKKESEAQSFDLMPAGKYHTIISDVEMKESNSAKNKGKPMYNIEFTVQETGNENHDKYAGRKVFTNACLWEGALYTIINIMKALGYAVEEGALEIPEAEELLGKELITRVVVTPERTVVDENTGEKKTYEPRNEPKGFFAIGTTEVKVPKQNVTAGAASSGGNSILP
jgi:hypothetical protein